MIPTREQALEILHEHTKSENLRKHAYSVEAAMRAYARYFGEDEEVWGSVGLLHDFDYEKHPTAEEHPYKGAEILKEMGCDESFVRAVLSHASYTNVPRNDNLSKTLFAVDELCGLVTAVALVRPSKKLADVTVKSVKKKMKDKAFARNVNREEIRQGAADLGIELEDHIARVIEAMQGISDTLGL
jgi:putative nucleotidyltransferase with HDIG domain